MKSLSLNEIYKVLKLNDNLRETIEIKHLTDDITKIKDNTVAFHIKRDEELNISKFKELNNCFIITDQPLLNSEVLDEEKFIHVLNVNKAYQKIINYYRNLFDIPVIAITGTCGKTTTKEMIRQILEKKYQVAATISNKNNLAYNNDYLFSIDEDTDFGVFETAISYPGNLITGCSFFKPTIGVITNIGIDHLSGCKTMENYIRAKGEMLAGLGYQGTLIINNDDENIRKINFKPYKGNMITFGIKNKSDYYADKIEYLDTGMEFSLIHQNQENRVFVPSFGIHNVYNALAALSVLSVLGIDIDYSIKELSKVEFIRSHLEFHKGINNSTIIDDTWSSNPTSLKAALEVLKEKGKDKVKIVILSKISYLGNYAEEEYEKIGKMINDYGIDFIITTDSHSKKIGLSAFNYGMKPEFHLHSQDNNELRNYLECLLDKNSIALFKTSMFEQTITDVIKELIKEKKR